MYFIIYFIIIVISFHVGLFLKFSLWSFSVMNATTEINYYKMNFNKN